MKTYFDCIPCLLRQTLDVTRKITSDEVQQEQIIRAVLKETSRANLLESPPMLAWRIHHLIKKLTGVQDTYQEIKEFSNKLALKMLPELKEKLNHAEDPLEMAVRLAIAGNIIDFGVTGDLDWRMVEETIQGALSASFDTRGLDLLRKRLGTAKRIVYLTDNAGEIIFDRLVIEQLPLDAVTVVVKAAPIINDAVMEDAKVAGLTELVTVIDNGMDAPGTVLSLCSPEFLKFFENADVVIAKGQGNYESLSDAPREVFFLLKAKCAMVAKHLHCQVGNFILKAGGHPQD